jgi:hypothetical protein
MRATAAVAGHAVAADAGALVSAAGTAERLGGAPARAFAGHAARGRAAGAVAVSADAGVRRRPSMTVGAEVRVSVGSTAGSTPLGRAALPAVVGLPRSVPAARHATGAAARWSAGGPFSS